MELIPPFQGLNSLGEYTQGDGGYTTSAPGFVIFALQANGRKL